MAHADSAIKRLGIISCGCDGRSATNYMVNNNGENCNCQSACNVSTRNKIGNVVVVDVARNNRKGQKKIPGLRYFKQFLLYMSSCRLLKVWALSRGKSSRLFVFKSIRTKPIMIILVVWFKSALLLPDLLKFDFFERAKRTLSTPRPPPAGEGGSERRHE